MLDVTKQRVQELVKERDTVALLASFDVEPDRVRRYLLRLAYDPHAPLHDDTIDMLRFLSHERSDAMPEFFLETMRRQVWAMNEEGGNISWSAPEIIAATVAGNPKRFGDFYSFAFEAAIDELAFQPSLVKAYDLLAAHAPEVVADSADAVEELRVRLAEGETTYLSYS